MGDGPNYPLVVRNVAPLVVRGFMLVFMVGLAVITAKVLHERPPEAANWWQLYLLIFWAGGLGCLIWSFNQEVSVLRIPSPGSIHIERGKLFDRVEHWMPQARFWIEEGEDDDGDPYFKLKMDAPGGPLTINESSNSGRLEQLQQKINAAVTGAT